jgi:hypothetical protein
MSQYYQVGDQVLWNPGQRTSLLYIAMAEMLAEQVKVPTGITYDFRDQYFLDVPRYVDFVDAVFRWATVTENPVFRAMVDGFLAASLVVVDRAGTAIPSIGDGPEAGEGRRVERKEIPVVVDWFAMRDQFSFRMVGD